MKIRMTRPRVLMANRPVKVATVDHEANRPGARARGYDSKWDKARATFLSHRPQCEMLIDGRRCGAPAVVVDHREPHRGDQSKFWDKSNWWPLCVNCHSSRKQAEERRLSPLAERLMMPFDVGRSAIPVTIVCGPPGSGKSTYVKEHAGPNDIIIDLDVIRASLAGTAIHQPAREWTTAALEERNRILKSLASDHDHERAWFIIAAPERDARATWARKLGTDQIVVLAVPLVECVARIRRDYRRFGQAERMEGLAKDWWEKFVNG